MKTLDAYLPIIAALAVLIVLALSLAACKTTPNSTSSIAARLAVTYATGKYIERAMTPDSQAARAGRIVAVVTQVEGVVNGEVDLTVAALRAYVNARLPVDLSPADRILASTLIDVAAREVEARIGDGDIKSDALLKVSEVLGWIKEGAAPYATGS